MTDIPEYINFVHTFRGDGAGICEVCGAPPRNWRHDLYANPGEHPRAGDLIRPPADARLAAPPASAAIREFYRALMARDWAARALRPRPQPGRVRRVAPPADELAATSAKIIAAVLALGGVAQYADLHPRDMWDLIDNTVYRNREGENAESE